MDMERRLDVPGWNALRGWMRRTDAGDALAMVGMGLLFAPFAAGIGMMVLGMMVMIVKIGWMILKDAVGM